MNNLLLVGFPGVGKTTVLKSLASRLSNLKIGGFYTEEIRENGSRVGFHIRTFSGQVGILAHVSFRNGPHIGKYRVDIPQFEEIGVTALKNALEASEIILIDEIGKMELFSEPFRRLVISCLDSDKPVIATVLSRPHLFVDGIKRRSDVRLVEVTIKNRNRLVSDLVGEASKQL